MRHVSRVRATTCSGSGPRPTMSPSDQRSSRRRGREHGVERVGVGVRVGEDRDDHAEYRAATRRLDPYADHLRDRSGRRPLPAAGAVRPRGARAGHDVLVAAPGSARGMVERAGFAFYGLGEPWDRAERWAPVFGPRRPGRRARDPGAVHRPRRLRRAAGHARARRDWRPDLIVRETSEFASAIAAEQFKVPVVARRHPPRRGDRRRRRLRAIAAAALASRAAPDRLERPCSRSRRARLGDRPASTASAPGGRGAHRRLAGLRLVRLGDRSPELFRETADALADVPKRVLMTIGHHVEPAELGPLPANVHVERWVTQADVMPHAAAMVGHGGSGGTLQALAAGVPVAFMPLFVDGPANAARVARAGAGHRGDAMRPQGARAARRAGLPRGGRARRGRDPRPAAGRGMRSSVLSRSRLIIRTFRASISAPATATTRKPGQIVAQSRSSRISERSDSIT